MTRKYKTLSGRGGKPNPIDIHVGLRISHQRRLKGMTQHDLASNLGLTFQQVQKYESGDNRIACSRLYDLSLIFNVDIGFFFADMSEEVCKSSPAQKAGVMKNCNQTINNTDALQKTETLELVRNYYRITDKDMRELIFNLCKKISKEIVGRKPFDKEQA